VKLISKLPIDRIARKVRTNNYVQSRFTAHFALLWTF